MEEFMADAAQATYVMGHNIGFDVNVAGAEVGRLGQAPESLTEKALIDSKDEGTEYCAIPGGRGGKFKWPTLTELHQKLFGEGFGDAHDAAYDVSATARCLFEMVRLKVIVCRVRTPREGRVRGPQTGGRQCSTLQRRLSAEEADPKTEWRCLSLGGRSVHAHVHSQFSVLQAVSPVGELVAAAKEMGMPALAVTDRNMMAASLCGRATRRASSPSWGRN